MGKKVAIKLNVMAKDLANAVAITKATNGNVLIGVMVKNFPNLEAAIQTVKEYMAAGVPVSVGLGAGDPAQWKKVIDVSVKTLPPHINQVFPAAGYTIGAIEQAGGNDILINALLTPSGTPGKVSVLTGAISQSCKEYISCAAAVSLLNDVGIKSVKFYPIEGDKRLDEVAAMVNAATKGGISIFEPTGGIDGKSVHAIVKTCIENGAETVIPHIYTAFVDKTTGITDPVKVAQLTEELLVSVR